MNAAIPRSGSPLPQLCRARLGEMSWWTGICTLPTGRDSSLRIPLCICHCLGGGVGVHRDPAALVTRACQPIESLPLVPVVYSSVPVSTVDSGARIWPSSCLLCHRAEPGDTAEPRLPGEHAPQTEFQRSALRCPRSNATSLCCSTASPLS